MKDVKISIVIPVYNIERYIGACIESVINQDFDGCEIIIVDDGSTDESGVICNRYAEKNKAITVYHKQNGGLSDARNYGLERACGEYVLFVDGDDTLSSDACRCLYNETLEVKPDMVIGCAKLSKPSSAMDRFERIARDAFEMHKVYSGKEYLTGCLSLGALRVEAWRSLYKRKFLLENKLFFKPGIAHEDEEFTPRALLKAKAIVLTENRFYNYINDRSGSITNSTELNPKKAFDRMTIYKELLELYKNVQPRKLRRLLEDDISWKYIDCCLLYKMSSVNSFKIQRFLPIKTAYHIKRRIKAVLFAISPTFYIKHIGNWGDAE